MSSIGNSLSSKFASTDFTDPDKPHNRVLVVGEEKKKFYVFAGQLSASSEFFNTLFNSNFKEKNENEIELKELAADDFHSFLKTLIPGNSSAITVDNFLQIIACAHRFLAPHVVAMCEKFVNDKYATLDKIDMLKMAFDYDWSELKDKLANDLVGCTGMTGNCPNGCTHVNGIVCYGCSKQFKREELEQRKFNRTSFNLANEARLSDLPAEIHAFLFKTLLKKTKE